MAQQAPQGPPDLDEVLRQWGEKIKRLFGGKSSPQRPPSLNGNGWNDGGGGAGGMPRVMNAQPWKSLIGLLVIVVLGIWLATGFYIVDTGEQGVVLRFGKYTETTEPGPNWRWPWPIGDHEIVRIASVRSVAVGYQGDSSRGVGSEALMLTEDRNIIDLQLEVQYDVVRAENFVFKNYMREADGRDLIKQATESAIREVVGKNKVDFLFNEGRVQVALDTKTLIQTLLDKYESGIRVVQVNIKQVQAPEQVQAAFQDVLKAGQELVQQKNEGLAYANDIVPKAQGIADSLLLEAEGYKQSVAARAEGDVARFRQVATEYAKAPQVTRQRMYLETLQQIYGNSNKVFINQKSGGGSNLLYLPLDKLMQLPAAPGNAAGLGTAPSSSGLTPPARPTNPADGNEREGR